MLIQPIETDWLEVNLTAYLKPEYIAASGSTLDYNAYEADLSTYAGSSTGRTGYDSSAYGSLS
ncbi:hypothetical protein CROQUDRAFT_102253 [Cronartium quercuum f. sp. fusiforme G11]|uniref:Uncharacterized protein n=1 Tax=Cronartium quercuum f. sp. fusiforme G11 TaxID=708437 RepID=A0A9P6N4V7_9BASI|nr:hypothetical protein CROQUDRAFT_102253 [Cronartium quercuum f. sp. fusiforme G11]